MLTGVRVYVPHASHDVFLGRLPGADESPRVGTVPGANGVGGAAAASGDQNGFHASARNLRRKWMKASKCARSIALQFTDRQHRSGQAQRGKIQGKINIREVTVQTDSRMAHRTQGGHEHDERASEGMHS